MIPGGQVDQGGKDDKPSVNDPDSGSLPENPPAEVLDNTNNDGLAHFFENELDAPFEVKLNED